VEVFVNCPSENATGWPWTETKVSKKLKIHPGPA